MSEELTVHCHARCSTLVDPVNAAIDRLRRYERDGVIGEVEVHTWPDQVALDGGARDEGALDAYGEFVEWAVSRGVSIHPPFGHHHRHSKITGESTEVVVFPVLCLAIYEGEELACVAPHATPEGSYAVADALAALAAGTVPCASEPIGRALRDREPVRVSVAGGGATAESEPRDGPSPETDPGQEPDLVAEPEADVESDSEPTPEADVPQAPRSP